MVITAKGYPGAYAKGLSIEGIEDADSLPGVKVFTAALPSRTARWFPTAGACCALRPWVSQPGCCVLAAYAGVARVRMQDGFPPY